MSLQEQLKKMDDETIIERWDSLRKNGLSITYLLRIYVKRISADNFYNHVSYLLGHKGVPATTLFAFVKEPLRRSSTDDISATLNLLYNQGLSKDIIQDYVLVSGLGDYESADRFCTGLCSQQTSCDNH